MPELSPQENVSPIHEEVRNETECVNCGSTEEPRCPHCGLGLCCASFECDCPACVECCRCSRIQDYGCRAYPPRNPRCAPYFPFLYLGVELEVEFEDDSRARASKILYARHGQDILLKEDGTLEWGFELVSGPFSLEHHKTIWPQILETARSVGARSWDYKSTGLHVHMSRNWFTSLSIGKLLVFVNSESVRPYIIRLAGRESPDFASLRKKTLGLNQLSGDYNGHYDAVNTSNRTTIEIRIFKGTLKTSHVLADIEFCHALAYWIKDVSIAEIERWDLFWEYVNANRKLYKNLIEYFGPRSPDHRPKRNKSEKEMEDN